MGAGTFLLGCTILLFIFAIGCIQPAPVHPATVSNVTPSETPESTVTPQPAASIAQSPSETAAPEQNVTISPAQGSTKSWILFKDQFDSFEYPGSWQSNSSVIPIYEYLHSNAGCAVTTQYNLNWQFRMFTSPDGKDLFYSTIVDSDRDIWPRDQQRQIDYADILNEILGDPMHCANTPAGAFTISGADAVSLRGVSFTGTRVDFGKIDPLGVTLGKGSMYVITGAHRHGVFTYYSGNGKSDTWRATADQIFNSIQLDPNF